MAGKVGHAGSKPRPYKIPRRTTQEGDDDDDDEGGRTMLGNGHGRGNRDSRSRRSNETPDARKSKDEIASKTDYEPEKPASPKDGQPRTFLDEVLAQNARKIRKKKNKKNNKASLPKDPV